jgi:hypothetical protein
MVPPLFSLYLSSLDVQNSWVDPAMLTLSMTVSFDAPTVAWSTTAL